MICPKCKSEHLQKKGKRNGKQRYRCMDCLISFTEGVRHRSIKRRTRANAKCPKCGSRNLLHDGKTKEKTQRYQCIDCGLNFSKKSVVLPEIKWKCPYCDGELKYSGYSKKGFREYQCKKCGKSCTGDSTGKPIKREVPFYLSNKEVKCPVCGSFKINKSSNSSKDYCRYTCRNCGKIFSNRTKERVPLESLVPLILAGKNIHEVVKNSGYTSEYLRKYMRPYYKEEIITSKQQQDIIRYGYYLKVPIDYLAEYIKCSEHKCREVLNKYKKKLMSTSSCAI